MEEKIINVGLYGGKSLFGGREKPLEASIIKCDKYDKCSYYKNNQCFNVRSFGSGYCKHGKIDNVQGYTSRAKKYYDFKNKWQNHESYGKLNYPSNKLGIIDNEVVLPYTYIEIIESKDGEFDIKVPYFSSSVSFIEYGKFDIKLIKRICDFQPQAMMGGQITDYQKKIVPLFLAHLREILPERFNEFKNKYPDYIQEINYIGRKALLKTIKPSTVYYKSRSYPEFNEEWYWDGEILIYKKGYIPKFNIIKGYDIVEIKIIPSDKAVITISDNNQVAKDTIFVN
ncbi:hypothetical protein ACFHWD_03115 [Clostridium sp. MT-14]|uniref:hypothetical protein n=1 Tax=Clostridium sp. MT-14 TaxID=3348360 RepID=UPI0035F2A252